MDVIASSVCKAMYFKGDLQFKKRPEPKPRGKKKPKPNKNNKQKTSPKHLNILNFPIL